jgi:hypothetical protein
LVDQVEAKVGPGSEQAGRGEKNEREHVQGDEDWPKKQDVCGTAGEWTPLRGGFASAYVWCWT